MILNPCFKDIYIEHIFIAFYKHELNFVKIGLIPGQTAEFEFSINSVLIILYVGKKTFMRKP